MRVVVAPATFKGTLAAPEAAAALASGWRRGDREADVRELPVADGGEGTLDVLVAAFDGSSVRARVSGPLGDPVDAAYGLADARGGRVAIVEMARASGLSLVHPDRRDPRQATTYGTGELMLAAAREGVGRILVCLGGSATNDAGAGMARALGVRLLDERGRELEPGGAALRRLATIDLRGLDRAVRDLQVVAATDVRSPLLGPTGASRLYASQKGARAEAVRELDDALAHFAAVVNRDLGIDIRSLPGGGAAGGLGAGLVAFLGAHLRPGFDVVADALGLADALEAADVVVTGEGRWDAQSLEGKAPAGVLRLAREAGCRSVLVAGGVDTSVDVAADVVYSLAEHAGHEASVGRARDVLEDAGEALARELSEG